MAASLKNVYRINDFPAPCKIDKGGNLEGLISGAHKALRSPSQMAWAPDKAGLDEENILNARSQSAVLS